MKTVVTSTELNWSDLKSVTCKWACLCFKSSDVCVCVCGGDCLNSAVSQRETDIQILFQLALCVLSLVVRPQSVQHGGETNRRRSLQQVAPHSSRTDSADWILVLAPWWSPSVLIDWFGVSQTGNLIMVLVSKAGLGEGGGGGRDTHTFRKLRSSAEL